MRAHAHVFRFLLRWMIACSQSPGCWMFIIIFVFDVVQPIFFPHRFLFLDICLFSFITTRPHYIITSVLMMRICLARENIAVVRCDCVRSLAHSIARLYVYVFSRVGVWCIFIDCQFHPFVFFLKEFDVSSFFFLVARLALVAIHFFLRLVIFHHSYLLNHT